MLPLTKEYLIFAGAIIAISFVLTLIVTLISKQRNKNERTLKNITTQISLFRDEVASTIERINITSRDCQQAVDMKVGLAEDMVRQVADSLESLSQHQEDLSALEAVCVNYKNALEKLRTATEQAEARIQVVQKDAKKVETVNDFIRAFRADIDTIKNQLEESKNEYVRLVASTEESLKSAADAQKKANQDMLAEFEARLARYRTEFGDYVSSEKSNFGDFLAEERKKSDELASSAESRRDEIKKALEDASQRLGGYKIEFEAALSSIEERNGTLRGDAEAALSTFVTATYRRTEEAKAEINQIIEDAKRKIDELMAVENDKAVSREKAMSESIAEVSAQLDNLIKSKGDEFAERSNDIADAFSSVMGKKRDAMERSLVDLAEKLEGEEASIRAAIDDLRRTGNEAEANTKDALKEALSNAESARASLDADRNVFIASSRDAIARDFNEMLSDLDARFSKMKDDGELFLSNLDNRMQDTRETIAQLSAGEGEKISAAIDRLKELDDKIKSSEEQLSRLFEEITRSREELFTVQQERSRLDNGISERDRELGRIQDDMQSSKIEGADEEEALMRLKQQIDSLQDVYDASEVEIQAGEPAEPEAMAVEDIEVEDKAPEDMIEEFPEDIFTGSIEDVDLSDDEDEKDEE